MRAFPYTCISMIPNLTNGREAPVFYVIMASSRGAKQSSLASLVDAIANNPALGYLHPQVGTQPTKQGTSPMARSPSPIVFVDPTSAAFRKQSTSRLQ